MDLPFKSELLVFAFVTLGWTPSFGQTPRQTPAPRAEQPRINSASEQQLGQPASAQPVSGSISGTVVDQSGAVVEGARVSLARPDEDQSLNQEALSGGDGRFSFASIPPGPFHLTITSAGFATQTFSGNLHSGETYVAPQIALTVATNVTDVEVGLPQIEVAEEQIKIEEKQRVLGVLPNFYVSYVPSAAPLTSKQKFKLAWKTSIDPVTLVLVGVAAGVEQAENHFAEYGQGAQGYGKRYGAGYADTVAATFIGGAILPSLLKQDPRYFYKGTGSTRSRILYAIANAAICKGDNGRWQANYSGILGSLAAGGFSNLYYPRQDRYGAGLTFENTALGIGATAFSNLLQEFVIRKLTPKAPKNVSGQP
jgi:hypothetical protein